MCALPISSATPAQLAIQPLEVEPIQAKPSASMQSTSNRVMTPDALVLAIQMISASNMASAADLQKGLTLPDRSTYTGEIKNGQPQGRGIFQYDPSNKEQRQRYEGEFLNGLPHGEGTMSWLNGDKYSGGWKNGQRHGRGNHTYADGRNYQGAYEDDTQQGQGVLKWPNGKSFTGLFEKDEAKAGKLIHPNGNYAEGSFKDGRLWEGILSHLSPQGRTSQTKYKDGKENTCNIS